MEKRAGIITIIDRNNYGNRLQNYALSFYCNNILKINTYTLENHVYTNNRFFLIRRIFNHFKKKNKIEKIDIDRRNKFKIFDKNIKYYNKKINTYTNLDTFNYLIVGSDQVWNPNYGRLSDIDTLKYVKKSKKISYAASFGIDKIDKKYENRIKKYISRFDRISVREDIGKKILNNLIDKNVEVNIDPTLLLNKKDWDNVLITPKDIPNKKFILCYFLGNKNYLEEINRIAKEKDLLIINLLDKKDKYYVTGPGEFLWLIKNSSLVCTDSFHASIFSFIYDVSFVVFERKNNNIYSRINTLLNKFDLKSCKYNDNKILDSQLKHDYSKSYKLLEKEKVKSKKYLCEAMDINYQGVKDGKNN